MDALSKLGTTSKNDVEEFEEVCRLRKVFENEVLMTTCIQNIEKEQKK